MSSLGVRVTFSSLLWSCLSTLWEDWRPEKRVKILWIFALNKSMTYFGILRNLAYFSHARGGRSVYFTPCVCVSVSVCIPSFRSQESASDLYSLAGCSGRARVQIWYRVCPDHWSETIAAVDAKWFRSGFGFCTGLGSVYRDDPQFTLKVQVCKSTHCFHFAQCLVTVLLSDPSVSKNNSKVVSDMMLFSINSWNY